MINSSNLAAAERAMLHHLQAYDSFVLLCERGQLLDAEAARMTAIAMLEVCMDEMLSDAHGRYLAGGDDA